MRPLFACVALLFATMPAFADRIAPLAPQPLLAAVTSDAVVVGTVTAVEDDPVKAKPHPSVKQEVEYRVLVVKVNEGLYGAKNVTQVRVALPVAEFNSPARVLKEDAKFLLYLVKHPTTNLYVTRPEHPSVNMTDRKADEMLRRVKLATAAIANPVKALKAESKDDRVMAACALTMYYRRGVTGPSQEVDRPADESKLLLETLAEAEWTLTGTIDAGNPFAAVSHALVNGGLKLPVANGKADYPAACQKAFKEWLAAKGQDARVRQLVAKE